jgi:hypothetical protein
MNNQYSELFDLYLEDIEDSDTIPSEFILSSKVVFLSNATSLPAKVKDHTLSFVIGTTKEEAEANLNAKLLDIVKNSMEDLDPQEELISKSFVDAKREKGSQTTLEDLHKMLVINSSGMPDNLAKKWMMEQ